MQRLDAVQFLKSLVREGISDIHLKVNRPPLLRIRGTLLPAEMEPMTQDAIEELVRQCLARPDGTPSPGNREMDYAYGIPGLCRFRINVFRQRGTYSMIFRVIPFDIPTLDALRMPAVAREIALYRRGLVLVTGVTGSGKSTTLASLIEYINSRQACHIVTLEDPIEFLYKDKKASINQREIGVDTADFATALRSALRQDPDVILVGEMRDAETMETALAAAESGHLVFSTLHTGDAKETLGRLIDSFPANRERQIRQSLSSNLAAVICQRLVERADGQGRVLAAEVMVVNAAIRGYILDPSKTGEILDNMAKGRDHYGSQTFDQCLHDLVMEGAVTAEEALRHATSVNDLKLALAQKR